MSCFVTGCKTGYRSEKRKNKALGVKNTSLFKASTKDMLNNWQNVLSRPDKLFTEKDRVCSRDLTPDQIETEYVTVMPDGTVNRILKGKPTLKSTAIPSILLELAAKSVSNEKHTHKRTSPLEVEDCSALKRGKNDADTHKVECELTCEEMMTVDQTADFNEGYLGESISQDKAEFRTESLLESFQSTPVPCSSCISNIVVHENHQVEFKSTCEESIPNSEMMNIDLNTDFNKGDLGEPVSQDKSDCTTESLLASFRPIPVPSPFWTSNTVNDNVMFTCRAENLDTVAKRVVVCQDLSLRIFMSEKEITIPGLQSVESVEHIARTLTTISNILPCKGVDNGEHANSCSGYVHRKKHNKTGQQSIRCLSCKKMLKSWSRKKKALQPLRKEKQKNYKLRRSHENVKRRNNTLKRKNAKLRQKVKEMQTECSKAKTEAVDAAISDLPENQQLAVQACFTASRMKSPKSIRYTNEWIFQCLLLRIKSRKLYEHLRAHKILILPCIDTLNKYIKAIKGVYGFDTATFKVLKEKVKHMNPQEKHGVILLDEMKLSKAVSFDRQNLELQGFTNLGNYTPDHQKDKRGDHALVLMFQPLQGKWVQALACFLSKGCAPGANLYNILMECIALTEQCGLHVDAIASDGATWNRNMWDKFGVTEETVSVEHIFDPSRRLWFVSDFPHLIKNLRNWISKNRIQDGVWTPDGILKLKHWDALFEIEDPKNFNLKANFKLTKDHIRPEYYQKMNVAMAFQFFGAADAMELFENDHDALKDSKSSQVFCRRIKKLIKAMNSRTPIGSMKVENQAWDDIKETLEYLRGWEKEAKAKQYDFFSNSTCYGLKISLQAALEVCQYLIEKCEFEYIMTARLNQDNLKRFFGMMRSCCGNNDHPDSTLFVQMYRLLSTYSLVKPPKGSNVTGGDTIGVLLSIKDLTDISERKAQWDAQIDTILDRGSNVHVLFDAAAILKEHDYFKCSTSEYVLAYVAGYVARKGSRFAVFEEEGRASVCESCLESLELKASDIVPNSHKLIQIKTKGWLKHPSEHLLKLISLLEEATLETLNTEALNANTLFSVTEAVQQLPSIPFVGCDKHELRLTNSIVRFYLNTRMFFICKQANKNDNIEKNKTRERRKASKLSYAADGPKDVNSPTVSTVPGPNKKGTAKRKRAEQPKLKKTLHQ